MRFRIDYGGSLQVGRNERNHTKESARRRFVHYRTRDHISDPRAPVCRNCRAGSLVLHLHVAQQGNRCRSTLSLDFKKRCQRYGYGKDERQERSKESGCLRDQKYLCNRLQWPNASCPWTDNGQRSDLRQFFHGVFTGFNWRIGQILQSANHGLHVLGRSF